MEYAARTDIGVSKLQTGGINEDSVSTLVFDERHREGVEQSVGVFVVADGVGAYDNSDYASYVATTIVPEELSGLALRLARDANPVHGDLAVDVETESYPTNEDVETAVADAIEAAHDRIVDTIGLNAGATTVVAGLYANGSLHLGWVGDSKAGILNRTDGELEYPTRDHSIVQHYVEEGSLHPDVARVHEERSTIVRAVGGSDATVETTTVPVYGDDVVVIASDGLYDAYDRAGQLYRRFVRADDDAEKESVIEDIREKLVTDDEIADIVLGSNTLDVAAESLVGHAQKKGGSDNVSVLLFGDATRPRRAETGDDTVRDHDAFRDGDGDAYDLESDETVVKE